MLRGWSHGKANAVPGRDSRASSGLVLDQQPHEASKWAAVTSIAPRFGCAPQTLLEWVRQGETDAGKRPGLTTSERERFKQLERENFELRRANEIPRKASAYFARADLGRHGALLGGPTFGSTAQR